MNINNSKEKMMEQTNRKYIAIIAFLRKFLSVFFSLFFIVYIYCYFFNIIIRLFSQVTDPILKIILLETSLYIFHLSLHKKKCNVERCTFSMLNTLSDLQTKTLGYYIFACFIFHNSISGRFLSSHS